MDPLVEIRGSAAVPNSAPASVRPTAESLRSWQRLWTPKSTGTAKFYGPGTTLKFHRGQIAAPLVYVCKGTADGTPDASLIESSLPVDQPGIIPEVDLPYWPSYRAASPEQRSRYLDWLLGGRIDSDVPIGYVFIYFYGLERRVLVDGVDHDAVAAELLRLLKVYRQSRAFVRYGTGLLWTTLWLSAKRAVLSKQLFAKAISRSVNWSEEGIALCLACFAHQGIRLPVGLAYRIAGNDVRAPRSVITQRHAQLHEAAFQKRFQDRFPEGMELTASKRERRLEYFAASATLGRIQDSGGPLSEERVPNVLGLPAQFQPLIDMWTECIDELTAYDRAHRKARGSTELTAGMYEALPENLRRGDHPHFEAWYSVMNQFVTDDGWTVLPVSELAKLENISERKKLTKLLSVQLATTALHMGLALEPDPRITGQPYAWDDLVSVFPATEELSDDVASYHAAATLLELGVAIAAADGQIDEIELGRLTSHLESQFELTSQDAARLAHLRYLLARRPPQEFSAARTLQKNLSVEQRRLVGEFLVGIAAADEVIAPLEVKALGKAYRALGLDAAELNRLLQSVAAPVAETSTHGMPAGSFQLDLARINAIMAETAKVTEFLRDALREDFENEPEELSPVIPVSPLVVERTKPASSEPVVSPSVPASDHRLKGLSDRFLPFATAALGQEVWTRSALNDLAKSHGLMLGAALEAVNEWAYDTLPDALFVDSDTEILVQTQLLS